MSIDLLIGIVSVFGAIVSLVASISAIRREDIKTSIDVDKYKSEEAERKRKILDQVSSDTVGLYRKLASQYQEMNEKDKKLLRTVTFVIRRMIMLERTVSDLLSEMEIQWDVHAIEAQGINCPFYDTVSEYMYSRVVGINDIIQETMAEVDTMLLNGHASTGQDED